MKNGALILALYMTSTLAACAQPGPDGPPPGYAQGQPGYGQDGGPPLGYGQQGWAGGMQSAPAQGPEQGPPPAYGPQDQSQQGGGRPKHMDMAARFRMANTTNDGRLTLAQAQAGGMPGIAKHFRQIDRDQKGYVTLQDVREWHHERRADKRQAPGAAGAPQGGPYPPPSASGQQY